MLSAHFLLFLTSLLFVLVILVLLSPLVLAVCKVFAVAFLCKAFAGSSEPGGEFPQLGRFVRLCRLMRGIHACLPFGVDSLGLVCAVFPCMSLGSCRLVALVGVLAGLVPRVSRLFWAFRAFLLGCRFLHLVLPADFVTCWQLSSACSFENVFFPVWFGRSS